MHKLTAQQTKLLLLVPANEEITIRETASKLDLSTNQTRLIAYELKELGLISIKQEAVGQPLRLQQVAQVSLAEAKAPAVNLKTLLFHTRWV